MENEEHNPFSIFGQGKKKKQKARTPVEAPEGITNVEGFERAVTVTQIQTLDMISEGEIDGLVTGEHTFSGTLGDIGWTQAIPNPYEPPSGTDLRWLRSIYWNGTPVVDSNSQFNFQQVSVTTTKGTKNGARLTSGQPNLTVTRSISERLRGAPTEGVLDPNNTDFAKTYRILNNNVTSARVNVKTNQLFESVKAGEKSGDVKTTKVNYKIYYRPIFNNVAKIGEYILGASEQLDGKITNGYVRSSTIEFDTEHSADPDFIGWEIRILRSTPDATNLSLRNQTFVDSITEVYSDVFTYPDAAIVRSKFNAEFFSQVPARAFDTKLLKVKVPSNYNPIARTYSNSAGAPAGAVRYWDGTFKAEKEWTNNPAWCFYDLVTNRRYGLGKFIDEAFIDKWTLYEIAQYCDELVSDGLGGLEPRFTCNMLLTSRDEAFRVMNDMASIFRGIVYYAFGSIYTIQDSPKAPMYLFTNANVENGNFTYSSSSKKARHTVALVRYNDKNNFYQPAIEYVEDTEGIKRFGIREKEVTAFGVTSRGQARRLGQWTILSETLETETVSFTAGMDASYLRPGDIFNVHDQHRKKRRLGGRTLKLTNNITDANSTVLLDSELTLNANNSYLFRLLTPTFALDGDLDQVTGSDQIPNLRSNAIQTIPFLGAQASGISGQTEIFLEEQFNETGFNVRSESIWSIELVSGVAGSTETDLSGQLDQFRVLKVAEEEGVKHKVTALEYRGDKFLAIESGLTLNQQIVGINQPAAPQNLALSLRDVSENSKIIDYSFTVPDPTDIESFFLYVRRDQQLSDADLVGTDFLVDILDKESRQGSFLPIQNGKYFFRLLSRSFNGLFSASSADNDIDVFGINALLDSTISSLRLSDEDAANAAGTKETGIFDDESPEVEWQFGIGETSNIATDISYRITVRQPSDNDDNLPDGGILFEETGVVPSDPADLKYLFEFDDNEATNGGPHRSFDLVVEAMTPDGNSSAGGNFLTDVNSSGFNDSLYNNPQGYDIIFLRNPPITGIRLTDIITGETCETSLTLGGTCTDQWISADGNINIEIISGTDVDDRVGGFVYFRTGLDPFTQENASGLESGVDRRSFVTAPDETLITVAAGLSNPDIQTGYVALSMYDVFDQAVGPLDAPLTISNVVQLVKRGNFLESGLQSQIDGLENRVDALELATGELESEINCLGDQVSGIEGVTGDNPTLDFSAGTWLIDTRFTGVLVDLPAAAGNSGLRFTVKDWYGTSDTNEIVLRPNGDDLIDDLTGVTMSTAFISRTLAADNTGWRIVGGFN